MPESTSGLRSVLSQPWAYNLAQTLMGAKRARKIFSERYIRAKPADRMLDLGCGTAEILDNLPDVEYVGYDISPDYITACQGRYPSQSFKVGTLPQDESPFDIVMALSVLHHLSDDECVSLFRSAKTALKPNGRILTLDPCRQPGQNPIARLFFSLDRGRGIRNRPGYEALAIAAGLRLQKVEVTSDLMPVWVPYTHCVMELSSDTP